MLKTFSLNWEPLFIKVVVIVIYLTLIFIIQKIQRSKKGIFLSKCIKLLKSQS